MQEQGRAGHVCKSAGHRPTEVRILAPPPVESIVYKSHPGSAGHPNVKFAADLMQGDSRRRAAPSLSSEAEFLEELVRDAFAGRRYFEDSTLPSIYRRGAR